MGANVNTVRRADERLGWLGNLGQPSQEDVRATVDNLCQSHAQCLAALVASSEDAILSLDLDGTIATWNRGAQDLFGYAADEVIGKSILSLLPTERQAEEPNILARVGRGEHVQHYETVRLCKDGRRVAVSLSVSPIMDAGGTIIGASKIARDITAHKLTEEALAKRAAEQTALYQFTDRLFRARSVNDVYEAALDAIVGALACDHASILMFDGMGVMRFTARRGLSEGYRSAVEGHSPWTREAKDPRPIAIGDIGQAELGDALRATVRAEGIAALAFIPLVVKGELVGKFMAYYDAPHACSERELDLAVTIARQLGFSVERMRAEEAKELLLNESKHRIKNTLATVQAIAGQTLRNTPRQDLERFLGRLYALDKAHDLLTAGDWDQVALGEVVSRALMPFERCGPGRVVIGGPSAALAARKSLMLTLCLHELATNAAKYGALSNCSGKVYVSWELTGEGGDRKVKLSWRETGGPTVSVPERKGFGSLLIEQSLGGQGESRLEFSPEGLRCCLHLSLE